MPGFPAAGTRILVVEDDPDLLALIDLSLTEIGCHVHRSSSARDALEVLTRNRFDVVVTDVMMAGMSGFELCERIVANRSEVPVIVMTVSTKLETAITAIRVGAYDFISKPIHLESLQLAVVRAAQHRSLHAEVKQLRHAVAQTQPFDELLGASEAMRAIFPVLRQYARSDASVAFSGERGARREVAGRAARRGPATRPCGAASR